MAETKKRQREGVDARVYERFECMVSLREACPSSRGRPFSGHEVHQGAPEARHAMAVEFNVRSEAHFFFGLSGDVTQGGVFISTYLAFQVESCVEIQFSLPDAGATLRLCGEVRWIRESSAQGAPGIGIGFDDTSAEDRRRLHDFCTLGPSLHYAEVG